MTVSPSLQILQAAAAASMSSAPVNLLSVAQAGAESTATWVAGGGTAAGAAQSTTKARTGTHSWAVTADGTAINSSSATRLTGLTAGVGYDLSCYAQSNVALGRNGFIFVQWYAAGGGVVGSQTFSSNVSITNSSWLQATISNVVAPATATQLDFFIAFGTQNGSNLPASELAFFDDLFVNVH